MELFSAMRGNYQTAARNLWFWQRRQHPLLKLFTWPWPLLAGAVLSLIGACFTLLTVLDNLSVWLRRRRESLINRLETAVHALRWQKSAYFIAPLFAVVTFPLGILLGLFPKFSSEVGEGGEVDINSGFFFRLAKTYWLLAGKLLTCLFRHGLWFFPFALLIAVYAAPAAILAGLFFLIFILLDALGFLIDLLRRGVVNSSRALAGWTDANLFAIVIAPILLAILFPLYLLLLLIPKISTYDSGG